jgi:hypothetical protein
MPYFMLIVMHSVLPSIYSYRTGRGEQYFAGIFGKSLPQTRGTLPIKPMAQILCQSSIGTPHNSSCNKPLLAPLPKVADARLLFHCSRKSHAKTLIAAILVQPPDFLCRGLFLCKAHTRVAPTPVRTRHRQLKRSFGRVSVLPPLALRTGAPRPALPQQPSHCPLRFPLSAFRFPHTRPLEIGPPLLLQCST